MNSTLGSFVPLAMFSCCGYPSLHKDNESFSSTGLSLGLIAQLWVNGGQKHFFSEYTISLSNGIFDCQILEEKMLIFVKNPKLMRCVVGSTSECNKETLFYVFPLSPSRVILYIKQQFFEAAFSSCLSIKGFSGRTQ